MKRLNDKYYLTVLLIIHFVFIYFVKNSLSDFSFLPANFLIADLLSIKLSLNNFSIILFSLLNVITLWWLGKFISKKYNFLPSLIYASSPWAVYLSVAGSVYIYLLFLILVFLVGIINLRKGQKSGKLSIFISLLLLLFSNVHFLYLLPFALLFLILEEKITTDKKYIFFIMLSLTLFFVSVNIFKNEFRIFADPGLLNGINRYRGDAVEEGLGVLAKIAENKYLIFSEYAFVKYLNQLTPATLFTQEELLLGFSFSPPVYLGFVSFFMVGVWQIMQKKEYIKYFLLGTILVLPSMFSKQQVDLNKLILFYPVVLFILTLGFVKLADSKNKLAKIITLLSIVLVVFQLIFTINDIRKNEEHRLGLYRGTNLIFKYNE